MSGGKKTFDHFPLNGTFHRNLERETNRETENAKRKRKREQNEGVERFKLLMFS